MNITKVKNQIRLRVHFLSLAKVWGRAKVNGVPGGLTLTPTLSNPLSYAGTDAADAELLALCVSASNAPPLSTSNPYNHHLRLRIGNSATVIFGILFFTVINK